MRTRLFILITLALTGCATAPYPVSSPYYHIPAGSRLVLKQMLTIPPHSARIYIQYGKVITPRKRDQYYAHCWFLSRKVLDEAQFIAPDTFIITGTKKFEDYVQPQTEIRLASLADLASRRSDNGPTAIEYSTVLSIYSDSQPDIFQFICNHWEDPYDAEHLTVAEIEKTLGEIATIELATD